MSRQCQHPDTDLLAQTATLKRTIAQEALLIDTFYRMAKRVLLLGILGWCFDCGTVVEMLNALDFSKIQRRCNKMRSVLPARRRSVFERLFGPPEIFDPRETTIIVELELSEEVLAFLRGRSTLAKCIRCGSLSVTTLRFRRGYNIDPEQLSFSHPSCGGQLVVSEGVRFHYGNAQKKILEATFSSSLQVESLKANGMK